MVSTLQQADTLGHEYVLAHNTNAAEYIMSHTGDLVMHSHTTLSYHTSSNIARNNKVGVRC